MTKAKVKVMTADQARACPYPDGIGGTATAAAYYDEPGRPIHLHAYELARGATLAIGSAAAQRIFYVWRGGIAACGRRLAAGSSFIVEPGAAIDAIGEDARSSVLAFAGPSPATLGNGPGLVHLLPVEQVPRISAKADSGTSGALHADGSAGTSHIWLNENSLPPNVDPPSPADARKGVHAHPEAEIIFITNGALWLGRKLFGSGAAIAIARDTFYTFAPGPAGATFITCRPSSTTQIRFAPSEEYRESRFWSAVGAIPYATFRGTA